MCRVLSTDDQIISIRLVKVGVDVDDADVDDVRVILILMKVGISTSTWFQNVPFCSLISEQFLFSCYDHSFRCP